MTTLTEKLAALPPDLVREVDDFVDFLVAKYQLSAQESQELLEMQQRKSDIEENRNIIRFTHDEWEAYRAEHSISR
jgi:hypothetical protein